jgi:hypothetical protein
LARRRVTPFTESTGRFTGNAAAREAVVGIVDDDVLVIFDSASLI